MQRNQREKLLRLRRSEVTSFLAGHPGNWKDKLFWKKMNFLIFLLCRVFLWTKLYRVFPRVMRLDSIWNCCHEFCCIFQYNYWCFQPNLALFQSILLSYIVVIAFDFLYWLWVFSLWWTCFFDWINRILEKKRLPFWTKKCDILVDDDDGDQICCGWTNRSAASTATPAGRWRRWPRPSATPPATRRRCCRWPNSTSSSTGVSTPAPTTTTTPTPTATATPTSTT